MLADHIVMDARPELAVVRSTVASMTAARAVVFAIGGAFVRMDTSGADTATYHLFSSSARPAVSASSSATARELGVRFSPRVRGYATGIRFYKGAGNGGVHTGTLWAVT